MGNKLDPSLPTMNDAKELGTEAYNATVGKGASLIQQNADTIALILFVTFAALTWFANRELKTKFPRIHQNMMIWGHRVLEVLGLLWIVQLFIS